MAYSVPPFTIATMSREHYRHTNVSVLGYCANVHNAKPVEISSASESRIGWMLLGNTWNDDAGQVRSLFHYQ